MVRSSIEKRSGTSVSRLEMARAVHGRRRSVEVRVPASTANLGSGFDCFGLALQLHLTVRATLVPEADERCRIRSRGEDGSALLPRTAEKNLIVRAMRFAAERQGLTLPPAVSRADAVHNLQRAALFTAALEQGRHDLLWEAMQDRLHQPHRQGLVPGLAEALATPRLPGLLGVSLSGAGPSVLAFAQSHLEQIGEAIAEPFRKHGIQTTVRNLAVDEHGRQTTDSSRGQAGSAEMGQVSGPGQGG